MNDKTDFLRRLPDSNVHFAKTESLWFRLRIDPVLLLLLMALTVFGLVVLFSGSEQSASMMKRQIAFYMIAYGAMFGATQMDLALLKRWAFALWLAGVILLVLVIFIGVEAKGAQRWLNLGFIRFQPSEMTTSHYHCSPQLILRLLPIRSIRSVGSRVNSNTAKVSCCCCRRR